MLAPKIRLIKVADIKRAPYNPPNRSEKAANSALMRSLEEIGLQYPLLVTADNDLVDGHRRLACLIQLGMDDIPCIETVSKQAVAYSAINTTAVRMTGNDALHLYYHDPESLTAIQKGKVASAMELVGDKLVRQMYDQGYVLRVVSLSRRTAKYCGKEGGRFVSSVAKWIMAHGTSVLETSMDMRVSGGVISKAIESGKALKTRVTN